MTSLPTILFTGRITGLVILSVRSRPCSLSRGHAISLYRDLARGCITLRRPYTVGGGDFQSPPSCFADCWLQPSVPSRFCWHIKCLMAHSLQVTAAVALFNSGQDEHLIAFRFYLRDATKALVPSPRGRYRGLSPTFPQHHHHHYLVQQPRLLKKILDSLLHDLRIHTSITYTRHLHVFNPMG
jgi:hypothetical protein